MFFLRSPSFIYLTAVGFIFSWWTVTLSSMHRADKPTAKPICQTAVSDNSSCPLPPFVRAKWHRALTGDVRTMLELLAEWQTEAQFLETQARARGENPLPLLPSAHFLRAQELAHKLLAREKGLYNTLPDYEWQEDDSGTPLSLPKPPERFLPQTELAATLLLTLCPPEQIVALPARMRTLPLFPAEVIARIPHDIDRHHSESLFALNPDVAFIAHYTQPSTVQTLREQQITPFLITRLNSLEEVLDTIIKMGHVVGQPEKAELLTLFVQAGMATLDNRLSLQGQSALQKEHHPLYLYAFSTLYAPTRRSLAGQLSDRLGINHALDTQESGEWSIPLSKERLQACAPSWVVFSLRDPKVNSASLTQHTLLQGTPAAINDQIFVVDEAFQDSPTHFLLLAYYDLVALIHPQLSDGAPY